MRLSDIRRPEDEEEDTSGHLITHSVDPVAANGSEEERSGGGFVTSPNRWVGWVYSKRDFTDDRTFCTRICD